MIVLAEIIWGIIAACALAGVLLLVIAAVAAFRRDLHRVRTELDALQRARRVTSRGNR